MARRKTTRGRSRPKKTRGVKWIGGMASMPTYITGEGEPYRPELLLWMGADGAILGTTIARPGELLSMASESLQGSIDRPMAGRPHRPARVRVASAELAEALRDGHPGLEVVCAPTPEIDQVLDVMKARLGAGDGLEPSYLSPEIDPAAMTSFFKAAAALYRAKPWSVVPDDQSLFSLTIEEFDLRDLAVSVIGQMGESFGILFFSGLADFEAFLDAADDIDLGDDPAMPPHFALNFERGADLAPGLREEIAEHRWEVAAPAAYPWLVAVDEDLVPRPPTPNEVTMAEALALALTHLLAEKKALRAAWEGGEPVSRTLSVATHQGELDVTLCAPYRRAHLVFDASHDVLADLAALASEDYEVDDDRREALEDELLRRFAASPEATDLEELHACILVMDVAASYFGQPLTTLDADELSEVLFEIIPRKVSIEASEARSIVEATRALYRFLKREYGLQQADRCLRVLGGGAAQKLEAALSDPSNFGMAKSVVMAGVEAGYDMESREGVEAWMEAIQGMPLPPSFGIPGLGEPPASPKSQSTKAASTKATKAKKAKRKAARKARKKKR